MMKEKSLISMHNGVDAAPLLRIAIKDAAGAPLNLAKFSAPT
jgi:hypothetical protein